MAGLFLFGCLIRNIHEYTNPLNMDTKFYPQFTMKNKTRNTLSSEEEIVLMQCISDFQFTIFCGKPWGWQTTPRADRLLVTTPARTVDIGEPSPKCGGCTHRTRKAFQNWGVLLTQPLLTRFMTTTRTGVRLLDMFVLSHHQPALQHCLGIS